MPALGGNPRRVAAATMCSPLADGASIFYTKSESSGIFRAEKSGVSEETVYNPEGNGQIFSPRCIPGGNDLLAVAVRWYRRVPFLQNKSRQP